MNFLTTFFYQPLFNILVGFYFLAGSDLGVATIIFTVFIRFLIWPWYQDIIQDQIVLAKIHPQMAEIKKKNAKNPQKANQEILNLYKEHKINPLGMILFLVFQVVLFLVLFQIFNRVFEGELLNWLYAWMPNPGEFNPLFLNFLPLNVSSLPLAIFASILQGATGYLSFKRRVQNGKNPIDKFNKIFIFLIPLVFIFMHERFPAIVFIYWITISLINVIQELIIQKKYIKV